MMRAGDFDMALLVADGIGSPRELFRLPLSVRVNGRQLRLHDDCLRLNYYGAGTMLILSIAGVHRRTLQIDGDPSMLFIFYSTISCYFFLVLLTALRL